MTITNMQLGFTFLMPFATELDEEIIKSYADKSRLSIAFGNKGNKKR
ncbi:MAG: hypothetical protein IPH32_17960 [Bacteroidetes bacterium]|nr:hypothetical protein [Bacteroidota bacterium]